MSSKDTRPKKTTGKRRKKGKRHANLNDITNVDRTFYELTINDLNNKLSRLRARLTLSEEKTRTLSHKLQTLEEDREDIASHLQRILDQRHQTLIEQEKTTEHLQATYKREKATSSANIEDLRQKYKDMKEQLVSEMKLLNGQLSSLHEFRRIRDILYEKYDDIRIEDRKRDQDHEQQIFVMQQKAIVERENMKKEVENKLKHVAQDFMLSHDIRNAGYVQRLIRENVALKKENDKLLETLMTTERELKKRTSKGKQISEENTLLKESQVQILKSAENKVIIIEKLTTNYEQLKNKYIEVVRYRNLYENLMKSDRCSPIQYGQDITVKLRASNQCIESIKLERNRLQALLQKYEYDMGKLTDIIQQIRTAIEVVIVDYNENELLLEKTNSGRKEERRFNLLCHLMQIIAQHTTSNTASPSPSIMTATPSAESVYRKGNVGLVPPKQADSLMEVFKRRSGIKTSPSGGSDFLSNKLMDKESKIIPKERTKDAGSIIDVEWGSSFYISSSYDDLMSIQVAGDKDDISIEYEESTSSFQSYHPENHNTKQLSVVELQQHISATSTTAHTTTEKHTSTSSKQQQSYNGDEEFSIESVY